MNTSSSSSSRSSSRDRPPSSSSSSHRKSSRDGERSRSSSSSSRRSSSGGGSNRERHHHHHHRHSDSSQSSRHHSSHNPSSGATTKTQPPTQFVISKEQLAKIEPFQLQKRKSAFQCAHLKFQSATPPPKIDTKILNYSFDLKRFVPYRTTTLEQNYKHLLLTEPDLGIPIDLINPNTYQRPHDPQLDLEDKVLLGLESIKKEKEETTDLLSTYSFLRKSEIIGIADHPHSRSEKRVTAPVVSERESVIERVEDNSPEAEIAHTEKLFRIARQMDTEFSKYQATSNMKDLKALRHPTNPSLKPVEMVSVFPDEDLWANTYARIIFDADPIPKSKFLEEESDFDKLNPVEQRKIRERVSSDLYRESMIISATQDDESMNNIVHYLLPKKRRRIENTSGSSSSSSSDQEMREYETLREYIVDMGGVNPDEGLAEEHYFLIMHKDIKEARFNSLGRAKITLTSKTAKYGGDDTESRVGSRTLVHHRDYTEGEMEARNKRARELYEQD